MSIRNNTSTQKQAAIDSLEQEQEPIAQVVTATKQSKESSDEEEHSTESELSEVQVKKSTRSRTSTISKLPSMVDSCLDAKIGYLLENYFLAKGAGHEVRKVFKENDFYNFKEFTSCDKQYLQSMRRSKNNVMKGFNELKITLIHDVLLYYHFLYNDSIETLANDPRNWVQADFKKWRSQGRHSSTTIFTAAQVGNTTTPPTAPVVVSATKKVEDAWLSWQCGKKDPTMYPILENDRNYTDWIINTKQRFRSERCPQVIDANFLDNMMVVSLAMVFRIE